MDGSEVVSSLQSFKPKHESVNVNELKGTLQDVEATFQKDTAARRAMRSKLERSASSVRRERSELQNMIDFRVQQAAIEEEIMRVFAQNEQRKRKAKQYLALYDRRGKERVGVVERGYG